MRYLTPLILAVLVVGCVSYSMTPTPGKSVEAKPVADCSFEVVSVLPDEPLEEVATISVTSATSDPQVFQDHVRGDVCSVGGDVVVTQVNGIGQIVRGVVLARP